MSRKKDKKPLFGMSGGEGRKAMCEFFPYTTTEKQ